MDKKKLRVVLITNNWEPYSGGVVSSLRMHIAALRDKGHEVLLITLDFLGEQHKDPDYVKRVYCPIRFMHKKNHMAFPWRAYKQVVTLLKHFKPDIIHTHHPFLLGVAALKGAASLKVPIIFTHHSVYTAFAHYIPLPTFITKPIITQLVTDFCNRVDGIIAPSSAIKKELIRQNIKTVTRIIFSAINPLFMEPFTKKSKRSEKGGYFDLLFVSRFAQEKNIPFLLNVFSKLNKNFRFTLAGYGHAYEALKKYAYTDLKLDPERVRFFHKPSPIELKKIYSEADLFVFGAQHETQGIVLAEAMACGLPIIALDGPGQRDIVKNGHNGFIIFGKEEMVQTIEKIAFDQNLYQKLSEGALKTAQRYTPEYMADQLLDFYYEILSKSLY